jgi:hypothetical protein
MTVNGELQIVCSTKLSWPNLKASPDIYIQKLKNITKNRSMLFLPIFEPDTSGIQARSATAAEGLLGHVYLLFLVSLSFIIL